MLELFSTVFINPDIYTSHYTFQLFLTGEMLKDGEGGSHVKRTGVGVPPWRLLSKKAGNFAAKTFAHGHSVARRSRKQGRKDVVNLTNIIKDKILFMLILKMQTSDLNSPVISQHLLTQHHQCSPGIDQLIQKAGKHALKI